MLALDAPGLRVVARPDALDHADWRDADLFPAMTMGADGGTPVVLRIAPDEAFGIVGAGGTVVVDDPDAIVVEETGFLAFGFETAEFTEVVAPHIEWSIPGDGLVQGSIAGVPAKVLLHADGAWILVARAYEHEFRDRLGLHG